MRRLLLVKYKGSLKVAKYFGTDPKPRSQLKQKPKKRPPEVLLHSLLDELASYSPARENVNLARVRKLLEQYLGSKQAPTKDRLAELLVRAWGKGLLRHRGGLYFPTQRHDGRIEIRRLGKL